MGSSNAGVRRRDEQARALARAGATRTTRRRSASTTRPTLLQRARPREARGVRLRGYERVVPPHRPTWPRATLRSGTHKRTVVNRNALVGARSTRSTASRPGTRTAPATCSSAPRGAPASRSSASCSASRASAPATPTRCALLRYGLERPYEAVTAAAAGPHARQDRAGRYRRGLSVNVVAGATVQRPVLPANGVRHERHGQSGPLAAGGRRAAAARHRRVADAAIRVRAGKEVLARVGRS